MPDYAYSTWDYIRQSVIKHYPDKKIVLINDLIIGNDNRYETKKSKVYSIFQPDFYHFEKKIRTPNGNEYTRSDKAGYGFLKICIPAWQLDHVCAQMRDKKLKFVVLDRDNETGTNHGKRKVIRTDESDNPEDANRY